MGKRNAQTLIIAPLDWGWGHATRILPLISWLKTEYHVIVAVPKRLHFQYQSLGVDIRTVPGYAIKYHNCPLWLSLFWQLPRLITVTVRTRFAVRKIVKKYAPSVIISDNRPFFRHRSVPSIYMTHQLQILHSNRFVKRITNFFHHRFIKQFNACWVPDSEDHFFAGELSEAQVSVPVHFIGGLSRFMLNTSSANNVGTYKKICILSGPEPKRSNWKKRMIAHWKNTPQSIIIGALPELGNMYPSGKVMLAGHLPDSIFAELVSGADLVVARSGYTTIMDLLWLQHSAVIIPTPGQTEQEYLAQWHHNKHFIAEKEEIFYGGNSTSELVIENIKSKFCSKQVITHLLQNLQLAPVRNPQ
jgi:hypothetical protein